MEVTPPGGVGEFVLTFAGWRTSRRQVANSLFYYCQLAVKKNNYSFSRIQQRHKDKAGEFFRQRSPFLFGNSPN